MHTLLPCALSCARELAANGLTGTISNLAPLQSLAVLYVRLRCLGPGCGCGCTKSDTPRCLFVPLVSMAVTLAGTLALVEQYQNHWALFQAFRLCT